MCKFRLFLIIYYYYCLSGLQAIEKVFRLRQSSGYGRIISKNDKMEFRLLELSSGTTGAQMLHDELLKSMKVESITESSNARRPNERSTSTNSSSGSSSSSTSVRSGSSSSNVQAVADPSSSGSSSSSTSVRSGSNSSNNVQAVAEPSSSSSSSSSYMRAVSSSNKQAIAEPDVQPTTDENSNRTHAGSSSDICEQRNMRYDQSLLPTESTCDAAVILSSISNEGNDKYIYRIYKFKYTNICIYINLFIY
jgi:hypothetical protein